MALRRKQTTLIAPKRVTMIVSCRFYYADASNGCQAPQHTTSAIFFIATKWIRMIWKWYVQYVVNDIWKLHFFKFWFFRKICLTINPLTFTPPFGCQITLIMFVSFVVYVAPLTSPVRLQNGHILSTWMRINLVDKQGYLRCHRFQNCNTNMW